jgi:hypothetical protein
VNAKLEHGRIIVGYVSREGRDISVHSLPGSHNVSVRRRLQEIFGPNSGMLLRWALKQRYGGDAGGGETGTPEGALREAIG